MVITLELLKESLRTSDADPALVTRQRRHVDMLRDELQRLNRTLQSLLTQTPLVRDNTQRFDARELVDDVLALLAPQAREQKVAISYEPPAEPVPLVGKRDRLKQALLNIVVNALEAMPGGGALTVALACDRARVHISVRDTGPGIPAEILGLIYQPHFTTKEGGTGIGLYVARSVVEAHGGTIEVESAAGAGTEVRLAMNADAGET
jgi:signal transduction histidine kinase